MAVLAQLSRLRKEIEDWGRSLDVGLVLPETASHIAREAAAIESTCAAIKSLAAARAAEGSAWKDAGRRSPAEDLAHRTGVGVGSARDAIETGRRLLQHPELSHAALSGELSAPQASLIGQAAECDPTLVPGLIAQSREASLEDLRSRVAHVRAAARDDEARRAAIRARRSLRSWTDVEGMWHLRACGNPEDGAQVMAALQPIANEFFHAARNEGRRERPDAYAFDALVQMAVESAGAPESPSAEDQPGLPGVLAQGDDPAEDRGAGSAGPSHKQGKRRRRGAPTKILIRVDYDTFLRGVVAPGETCELAGYGPVPVSVVYDALATGDPFIGAILTKGKPLVGVAHLGRAPTAHQQSALEWLYPTCAAKGCAAQARLERDHRVDWADTKFTMLDLLDCLCAHHHRLKTRSGWALVAGSGKRPFVPPSDPSHPRHSHLAGSDSRNRGP